MLLIVPVTEVPYVDFPELKFNDHESTEMPFRYVRTADGKPIMPEVELRLDNYINDLLTSYTGHGRADQEGC